MSEIIEALNLLAKEKNLDKEEIMQGIEKAIASACEKDYGKNTQYSVNMDRETGEIRVYTHKTVVEQIMDPRTDITLEEAQQINPYFDIDDEVPVEITTMDFGRIATQKAKGIILQQIKEGERRSVFNKYKSMEKHIVTGVVQRYVGKNISVALDDHSQEKDIRWVTESSFTSLKSERLIRVDSASLHQEHILTLLSFFSSVR